MSEIDKRRATDFIAKSLRESLNSSFSGQALTKEIIQNNLEKFLQEQSDRGLLTKASFEVVPGDEPRVAIVKMKLPVPSFVTTRITIDTELVDEDWELATYLVELDESGDLG